MIKKKKIPIKSLVLILILVELICLVFAGMGPEVSKRLGIPVVDPAYAIVSMAELLYSTGLTHSKRTWPSPERQTRSWQGGEFFF